MTSAIVILARIRFVVMFCMRDSYQLVETYIFNWICSLLPK